MSAPAMGKNDPLPTRRRGLSMCEGGVQEVRRQKSGVQEAPIFGGSAHGLDCSRVGDNRWAFCHTAKSLNVFAGFAMSRKLFNGITSQIKRRTRCCKFDPSRSATPGLLSAIPIGQIPNGSRTANKRTFLVPPRSATGQIPSTGCHSCLHCCRPTRNNSPLES
jgi:hypothetical protein